MATISEALAIAIQHHQQGRLQAAEQIYRQILQAEPNQPDALHLLGMIAHQTGRHELAVDYMGRAIALRANVAAFHGNLGGVYLALRRIPEAVACWRRALELNPDYAEAHNNLGNTLKNEGKLDEAVACYRRALELKPEYVEAHSNLGVALKNQGKLDEAAACYRRALDLKPAYAEAHNNLGNALREQGQLDEAVACWRRALQSKPDFAEAHFNLANALKDRGRLEEAVAGYRRALALRPAYAEAHNNLGLACKDRGKLDEAVAAWRRAIALKPDYVAAHNNLGTAFQDQGKLDEAAACYRRALDLNPGYAEAHYNLGNTLDDQGKPDEAVACWQRAITLKPDFAEAHLNLGNAFMDRGKLDEAVAVWRRALELKPDHAEAYGNLGNALRDQRKLDEAVACYRRALELKPDYAETHYNLGIALQDQGKLDEAVACYRRALELKPDYANAHNNLGSVLEEMGDFEGAEDAFRAALRHNGRLAFAHCNLAKLLGGKLPEQDLAAQRQLLAAAELSDGDRLLLHFGLAQVLDARGQYAQAAEHLERGNALQCSDWRRRGLEYDAVEHESFVARMIAACTPEFFQRVRGFGLDSEIPVFVVGLPRSGTTLVEQILASHSQAFGAGEIELVHDTMAALGAPGADPLDGLRRLDRGTAATLAVRHLERLRALGAHALRIVDKMPDNYLYLGLLASLFPRAKVIHCRRDLRDVAVSCWLTHFRQIRWASDPRQIVSRFRQYQRLMAHWREVLPAAPLEVDYEETVADLEGVARRLVAWCGLAWEPACLEFHRAARPVRTASAVQVRRPVYATSVGRWKHYEQALEGLFAELQPLLGGSRRP